MIMNKWNILIVDGSSIVRTGLCHILSESFDCDIVSEEVGENNVVGHIQYGMHFDLVILGDTNKDGEELINKIRGFNSQAKILVFTEVMHYPLAMSYLIAGANGFLTYIAPCQEIVQAVRKVLNQDRYLCMELLEAMAQETFLNNVHKKKNLSVRNRNMSGVSLHEKLSKRQKEIVDYLIKGETVSAIAGYLDIKVSTVATHKSILFEKLGVKNVLELIEVYYGEMVA